MKLFNKIFKRKEKSTINEKQVLLGIGHYFMEKSMDKFNDYDKAFNETYRTLRTMNITDCKEIGYNVFEINLCRPGILIGSKGSIIDRIKEKLGIKIVIKENKLADLVYPLDITQY